MVTTYPSAGKKKALKVCQVFAQGAGGRCAEPGCDSLYQGAAAFYGMTEHTLPLLDRCRRDGRDWYYIDNAYYWGRGVYHRVTRNRLMHDGLGVRIDPAFPRLRTFGVDVRERRYGDAVVITTQSELFYAFRLKVSRQEWVDRITRVLRQYTDRPIQVCHKPAPALMAKHEPHAREFEPMLANAWCMVTHSSSSALKALAEGVPVIWLGEGPDYGMCRQMADTDLSAVEDVELREDREYFFEGLLSQQWTFAEMASGQCWAELHA